MSYWHYPKTIVSSSLLNVVFFFRIKPVILGNGRCIQTDAVISGYEVPKGVRSNI